MAELRRKDPEWAKKDLARKRIHAAKARARAVELYRDPEWRAGNAAAHKAAWNDPEIKARRLAARKATVARRAAQRQGDEPGEVTP